MSLSEYNQKKNGNNIQTLSHYYLKHLYHDDHQLFSYLRRSTICKLENFENIVSFFSSNVHNLCVGYMICSFKCYVVSCYIFSVFLFYFVLFHRRRKWTMQLWSVIIFVQWARIICANQVTVDFELCSVSAIHFCWSGKSLQKTCDILNSSRIVHKLQWTLFSLKGFLHR